MLEILQRNLQVCQVSQECLWQVFVWNVFCRLEHLCSVCICISCKLVSSESKEGMSQAFGQISLGTHTVFTLPCLLAPVLPSWLVVTANSNLSIKWRCLSMGWGQQDGLGNRKVVLEKKSVLHDLAHGICSGTFCYPVQTVVLYVCVLFVIWGFLSFLRGRLWFFFKIFFLFYLSILW